MKLTKHYYFLAFGVLINTSAYVGILTLQSSINIEDNLGIISSSSLYISAVVICLFISPILLLKVGAKWSLVIGESGFVIYSLGNFFPAFYILIPCSIIGGFGEALVWTSSFVYINTLVRKYWLTLQDEEASLDGVRNKWFGHFLGILKSCTIWGNLLSYATLYGARHLNITPINDTNLFENVSLCGANFQKKNEPADVQKYIPASKTSIYLMLALFILLQIVSLVIHILFVPTIGKNLEQENVKANIVVCNTLKSTILHIISKEQILLTPVAFYYGFLISYVISVFSRSFISCTLGVQLVGLVMSVYGLANVVAALTAGRISQRFGLTPIFVFGLLYDSGNYALELLWKPNYENRLMVFLLGILLGVSDGLWQFLVAAVTARYFYERQEIAFGTMSLWTVLAMFTGFTVATAISVKLHIYGLIILLILTCLGFGIAEILRKKNGSDDSETAMILEQRDSETS